jgi:hypothetical protein
MEKSIANEEEEARKEEGRKEARRATTSKSAKKSRDDDGSVSDGASFDSDEELDESDSDNNDGDAMTEGSFVKLEDNPGTKDAMVENEDDPDIYEIDVLAWDSPLSPLHLAILGGHIDMIDPFSP